MTSPNQGWLHGVPVSAVTADLNRRILAAAIRNGHTPASFRMMCALRALADERFELVEKLRLHVGDLAVLAGAVFGIGPDTGRWALVETSPNQEATRP